MSHQGKEICILSNKCTDLLSRLQECFEKHDDISGASKPYIQSVESTAYKSQITWAFKRSDIEKIEFQKCIKSTCVEVNFLNVRKVWLEIMQNNEDRHSGIGLMNLIVHFYNLPENVRVLCDLTILNNNKDVVWEDTFCGKSCDLKEQKIEFLNFYLGFETRMEPSVIVNLFVQCRLKLVSNTYNCVSGKLSYRVNETPNIGYSMKRILESGKYSDVILKIKSSNVKSHKCILALKSSAMRILLKLNYGNEIEIINEKYITLKDALNFLYTENIEIQDFKHAWKLHTVAHKYDILNLKDLCSAYLNASLTEKNVSYMLDLSRGNEDKRLVKACLDFIKDHKIEDLTESFMGNSI